MIWQALVTGVIVAGGYAAYLIFVRKQAVAGQFPAVMTVGLLAAGISLLLRIVF
jgi:hypothetical protein